MKPITQETVLQAIPTGTTISFGRLLYDFILDEERQYVRLERTLEKLIQQNKIDVIKEISMFRADYQESGSMLRYYKFQRR